jgi:hypothetical protein
LVSVAGAAFSAEQANDSVSAIDKADASAVDRNPFARTIGFTAFLRGRINGVI